MFCQVTVSLYSILTTLFFSGSTPNPISGIYGWLLRQTCMDAFAYRTDYSNPEGMTAWMPVQELVPQLMIGDLLEFEPEKENGQTHWAIYKNGSEGQPQVVHLWKALDKFEIRLDNIYYVAAERRARRNNKYDKDFKPRSTEEIMECSRKMLGYTNYNLVENNCEHFATFCRNGRSISAQANKAKIDWAVVPALGDTALKSLALFHQILQAGLLAARDDPDIVPYVGWRRVAAAVGVAWDRVITDQILTDIDLNISFWYNDCIESQAVGNTIEMQDYDIILESPCSGCESFFFLLGKNT